MHVSHGVNMGAIAFAPAASSTSKLTHQQSGGQLQLRLQLCARLITMGLFEGGREKGAVRRFEGESMDARSTWLSKRVRRQLAADL